MRVDDLNKPFILKDHEELKNVRTIIEQSEYWSPKIIGDVIYNYWD
jgi:hypothetical protein